MGLLDLSKADMKGFEAIPSGTYNAEIYEVTMKETKGGENSKLPAGTPMFNIQFRITDAEYENRRVFATRIVAPAKINGKAYEHKAKMDGMLARFFTAIGYSEEEVTSGSFEPDLEDMVGRQCRVVVKVKPPDAYNDEPTNEVTGIKPVGDDATAPEGSGLL